MKVKFTCVRGIVSGTAIVRDEMMSAGSKKLIKVPMPVWEIVNCSNLPRGHRIWGAWEDLQTIKEEKCQ